MNETANVFMTMIETTLNKMIDARIEAKQDEKMQTLWDEVRSLNARLDALEEKAQNPTLGVAVMDLQSMEFACAVQKIIDMYAMNDGFITGIIDNDLFNDKITDIAHDAASSAADEAMDNHTSEYDHDDIHESSEIDEDAVREVIEEVLNNVTVTLKI
jgi:hypothetical protein